MFNLIKQLFMKTPKNEDAGTLAKDMDLAQLKVLAVELKLFTLEEVSNMKKPAILKAVHAWEKEAVAESKDAKTGLKKLGGTKLNAPAVESAKEDTYEGKKVVSRTEREINGKMYEDIMVEGGVVFTNPK